MDVSSIDVLSLEPLSISTFDPFSIATIDPFGGTPTMPPTKPPTKSPTGSPTKKPTMLPSAAPTVEPTIGGVVQLDIDVSRLELLRSSNISTFSHGLFSHRTISRLHAVERRVRWPEVR